MQPDECQCREILKLSHDSYWGHKPMNNPMQLRWFILLPGLAMWLGWGIRGQIGHSTGAMIPGAFLALAFCLLLPDKQFSRGLAIALTAVGFGFGADMTTMQTAAMVMGTTKMFHYSVPPTATFGYIGLVIKGALWALFGGAGLGLAFAASRYRRKDIVLALIFMVASYYAGWVLINRSKFVYFSADRPESWGGLLFAAIALLAWLTVRGRTRIPLVLALSAAVAGGIGYPIAVTLAGAGLHSSYVGRWYHWWKVAEVTFGTFMGVGLGIGTYLLKEELPDAEEYKEPVAEPGFNARGIILGVALAALCTALYQSVAPWIILGSFLLCAAYCSEKVAWHIGVTLTYYAAAADVVRHWPYERGIGNAAVLWVLAVLATLVVSWKVTTWWGKSTKAVARNAFVFVLWATLILSYLRMFDKYAVLSPAAQAIATAGGQWMYTLKMWASGLVVNAIFTVATLVLTWMAYRTSRLEESPGR
jgi:hypothetical protein